MRLPDKSNLSNNHREIFHVCMVLHGRIDALWERLIYTHAAMVGVMVFFATQADPFLITRVVVYVFYSMNVIFTFVAMRESYNGLQAGLADLQDLPRDDGLSHMDKWLLSLDYSAHPRRRLMLVSFVWLILGYLLFYQFFTETGFTGAAINPAAAISMP